MRSAHDGARHDVRSAVPARADRQHAACSIRAAKRVAARAAGAAGTGYILSTLSRLAAGRREGGDDAAGAGISSISSAAATSRRAAHRARAKAGFSALVVTIDTPVAGMRERDVRNGTKELARRGSLWSMLPLPAAVARAAALAGRLSRRRRADEVSQRRCCRTGRCRTPTSARRSSSRWCRWDDLRWIRDAWNGPIVVKGVHTADDARRAVDAGARRRSSCRIMAGASSTASRATLRVLPEVRRRGRRPDRGAARRRHPPRQRHRQGAGLGARAVLVGRAYAYGLGAGGGAGVARAIDILRAELVRTLKLLGCASAAELDRTFIDIPRDWLPVDRTD